MRNVGTTDRREFQEMETILVSFIKSGGDLLQLVWNAGMARGRRDLRLAKAAVSR